MKSKRKFATVGTDDYFSGGQFEAVSGLRMVRYIRYVIFKRVSCLPQGSLWNVPVIFDTHSQPKKKLSTLQKTKF